MSGTDPANTASTDVVRLAEAVKNYGSVRAVDGVDLTVGPGELVSVVGPSGCGKSTVLRLIAGLERPTAGRVLLGGRVVADTRSSLPPERRRVGLVFQDHALFPHLSVAGNVGFGLPRRSPTRAARIAQVLALVSLSELADRYPHELSGGEQQRVALARALAPDPPVVLLDEAFSALDRGLRTQIRVDTAAILRQTGTAAILVTHDRDEALALADRVVIMRGGRIEQAGTPQEVFERPATRFVAAFIGDATFVPAERDGAWLRSELGGVGSPEGLGPGVVELAVRPHEITLDAMGPAHGTVLAAEYQGAFVLYTVRLPSGLTLQSLQPHESRLIVGDTVAVGLEPGLRASVLVDGLRPTRSPD